MDAENIFINNIRLLLYSKLLMVFYFHCLSIWILEFRLGLQFFCSDFDRIALNLYISLERIDIITVLTFPIHEDGMCFRFTWILDFQQSRWSWLPPGPSLTPLLTASYLVFDARVWGGTDFSGMLG